MSWIIPNLSFEKSKASSKRPGMEGCMDTIDNRNYWSCCGRKNAIFKIMQRKIVNAEWSNPGLINRFNYCTNLGLTLLSSLPTTERLAGHGTKKICANQATLIRHRAQSFGRNFIIGTRGTSQRASNKATGPRASFRTSWEHGILWFFKLINGFIGESKRDTIGLPIESMYGIYANIGGIFMVNVTIYSIHGSYGLCHWIWWLVALPKFPTMRILWICIRKCPQALNKQRQAPILETQTWSHPSGGGIFVYLQWLYNAIYIYIHIYIYTYSTSFPAAFCRALLSHEMVVFMPTTEWMSIPDNLFFWLHIRND